MLWMDIPEFTEQGGALRLLTPARRLIGAALFPYVLISPFSPLLQVLLILCFAVSLVRSWSLLTSAPSPPRCCSCTDRNVLIKKKSFKSAWIYFFNDLLLFTRSREEEKQEVLFHVDLANVQLSVAGRLR
jgi:hypothetical protein